MRAHLALLILLALLHQGAAETTYPPVNFGYIAELRGSKVPDGLGLSKAATGVSFVTFTYNGTDEFLWDLSLDANTTALGPQSLDLRYQTGDSTFSAPLVTLTTDFSDPNGAVRLGAINTAITGLGFPEVNGVLNETDKLLVVLTTAGGAQAGRFTDALIEVEDTATNETYFLADVLGNATYQFGTTQDLTWFPAANGTRTQFTLDVTDNLDGTYSYSLYLTEDLKTASTVTLNFKGVADFPAVLTLPVDFEAAASYGDFNSFTAQELRAGLLAAGRSLTTELIPVIQFADKTGLAGPFQPAWTFDPTPPSPPPSPPSPPPPKPSSPPPPLKKSPPPPSKKSPPPPSKKSPPPPPKPVPFLALPLKGKLVLQSSTAKKVVNKKVVTYPARQATDVQIATFSLTTSQLTPWLAIDLGAKFEISKVVIAAARPGPSGTTYTAQHTFTVRVTNTKPAVSALKPNTGLARIAGNVCGTVRGPLGSAPGSKTVVCGGVVNKRFLAAPKKGRYLAVDLAASGKGVKSKLALAEITVFGRLAK